MVVVMVNGKKVAVPVEAPAVSDFKDSDLVGGTACHLAVQVLTSLKDKVKVKQESLSYLMSHQADGQYQGVLIPKVVLADPLGWTNFSSFHGMPLTGKMVAWEICKRKKKAENV